MDKLSPEDKDILISGLKNKEASIAYNGDTAKMEDLVGTKITPNLQAPSETDIAIEGGSPNPQDPENFAFYEQKKRAFDNSYEGKKILAYDKTAIDDPIENVNVALNIGRDQVFATLGAIGEWLGTSDGSFRKEAEKNMKYSQLDFNKPLDDKNASVFDTRFWTQKVPQSIPFMLAVGEVGLVGAEI